ncbi:MAG: class I SAM-dependent methyltransferase [Legionellaceae bacterium]|nr:class I SAM-dependent methyltransferase [Legionellaceae bacterium]
MDWNLFNKRCSDNAFFLGVLEQAGVGLVTADKTLFISKLFIEVARHLNMQCPDGLLSLRRLLWKQHFGAPTLDFLLLHEASIGQLVAHVTRAPHSDLSHLLSAAFSREQAMAQDACYALYEPYERPTADSSNLFVATMNNQGFMVTEALDVFSNDFIEAATHAALIGGQVLEIGAAYGVVSLEALKQGATVFCNDLDVRHLAVVAKAHAALQTGQLVTIPGAFPDEFDFEAASFDAILISRVLHFFSGNEVVRALKRARAWLKPGGCLFVVNETPFLGNWRPFLAEYEARKCRGDKWPGMIDDLKRYEKGTSFASSLPQLLHFFDQETLTQALLEAGFKSEGIHVAYINRAGQFPSNLLMPEKQQESVGCRAIHLG